MMFTKLEQLKNYSIVVVDTGNIELIQQYNPQDATTNPTLLLKAAALPQYRYLIDDAIQWAKSQSNNLQIHSNKVLQKLMVNFGIEILKIIPGRVSTEIDAHLSFDTNASIDQAQQLIALYQQAGIDKERVLIKLASTWEGIQAAEKLEKMGIHCNMTLIFSLTQAAKCADAGVTLISPFVGRIYDWYKSKEQREFTPFEDPGVLSVKRIYHYFKQLNYKTTIMGASFRHIGQIEALAGCDYLTINPQLLAKLKNETGTLQRHLNSGNRSNPIEKMNIEENQFRWQLNEDAMATEKLAEGIRIFARDTQALTKQLLDSTLVSSVL